MKNTTKAVSAVASVAFSASLLFAGVPEVTSVTMTQPSGCGKTVIDYTLSGGPAVVTLDVQTNSASGWVSIGADKLKTFSRGSDVWRSVPTGPRQIVWRSDKDWPGVRMDGVRAVVTAWSPESTPDYMVVDLSADAGSDPCRYYVSADAVPGGVLAEEYRRTKLLMKRIHAKNKTVGIGTIAENGRQPDGYANEQTRKVTFTNDFYLAVFETTQAQWSLLGGRNCTNYDGEDRDLHPAEYMRFAELRANVSGAWYALVIWPQAPYATSWIGRLNARTGLDFDLPSEAQWEFAARAGHGEGEFGDGTAITDATEIAGLQGRYKANGSTTAICGSFAPNDFGLYDMIGNVREYCCDWYQLNASTCPFWANVDPTDPTKLADGTASDCAYTEGSGYTGSICVRDGSYNQKASYCRPGCRQTTGMNVAAPDLGFRLCCRAGLD